jgi:hypothetical protein
MGSSLEGGIETSWSGKSLDWTRRGAVGGGIAPAAAVALAGAPGAGASGSAGRGAMTTGRTWVRPMSA